MNINQNYQEESQDGKKNKTEFIDHTPPDPEEQQNRSPGSQAITQKTKKDDTETITIEEEDDQWKSNMKNEMEGESGQSMFSKTCLLQANGLNQFILF